MGGTSDAAFGDSPRVRPRPKENARHEPLAVVGYRAVKDAIVTCQLAPGSVITEQELADAYGMSKTPIREALNRLREEGLVQTLPHRGTVISPITVDDIQHTYYLRLILEPETAALAAERATASEVKRIRTLFERMSATSPTQQRRKQMRRNTEFHLALAEASGNPKLATFMHVLLIDVERFYNAHHARGGERPLTHWDALVTAIEERDAARAREVTAEGIRSSRRQLIETLLDDPGA